jgi:RNA polymerase sigma-70 factor (ECF subfamily)
MAPPFPADPEALPHPSFEVLYAVARSYLPEALRLLKVPPDDVDDLIHDIVIIAHRGLDHYEPRASGGEHADPGRMLRAWLSGIAWRQVSKRRRLAYRRFELPDGDRRDLPVNTPDETPSSEQIAAETERRRILGRVLQQIPAERAEVLIMHTFLEMSAPDIARELGLNENTVKSRIARGRADVLAAMKRLRPDERSALEGMPLLLPLTLDRSSPHGEAASLGRLAQPGILAAAMLLVGMTLGAALQGRRAPEEPPLAAREPANLTSVVSPVASVAPPGTPPAAYGATASATTAGTQGTSMARELVLIAAAKHARDRYDYDGALARLGEHEREFPHGSMAKVRDHLRDEVSSARDRARHAR